MNKRGSSVTWFVIIIFIIMGLAMAQQGWDAKTIDELNNRLNWTNISVGVINSLENNAQQSTNEYYAVIIRIVEKAVDFMGYAIFETGKMASNFAYDNPNIINYKVLFALLILSLVAPLIYPLFIIIVSLILITKEWWMTRKEKKALELLEGKNERQK